MLDTASWYLALLLVGAAGLLPSALLFERLESRGVHVARPLALAIMALATWLVVALGGVPYGTLIVVASTVAMLAWSAAIGWRHPRLVDDLVARRRRILVSEGVFLLLFAVIALARAQSPDATETEKPGDLMFLTAVHQASTFPPVDPWLSGHTLSYYHLGQVQADHVARLAGLTPDIAFNLSTATAGAAAGVAAMGVALDLLCLSGMRRLRSLVVAGVTAVAGLLLVAPFVGPIQFLADRGIGAGWWHWLRIENVPPGAGTAVWWWPTSRVVPGAIDEYPGFTIALGDPHAHLFALPLGITALGLALVAFEGSTPLTWRRWLREPERWALASGLFAALAMTNSWDVITFGAIWFMAAIWSASRAGWPLVQATLVGVRYIAMAAGLAVVLAWPFLQTLDPNPLGLAVVRDEHTSPLHGGLLWLPVLLPAVAGFLLLRPRRAVGLRRGVVILSVPVVAWAVWLLADGAGSELMARAWGVATIELLVLGGAVCGALAAAVDQRQRGEAAALCLLAAGLLILLLTELFMSDDAFPGRLNTVFKFWFHVWAIFAVAAAGLLGSAVERIGNLRQPRVVMAGMAACAACWSFTMVTAPAMALDRAQFREPGMSATVYLGSADPGLAGAAEWARVRLDPEEDVLLQAVGEAYSNGNRLAIVSGIPTLLGWPGHERQWRGEIAEDARRAAVDAIYGEDRDAALAAAHEWGVSHVYIGREELWAYGPEVMERFGAWLRAYEHPDAVIFEVPDEDLR